MGKLIFSNKNLIELNIEDNVFYIDIFTDEATETLKSIQNLCENFDKQDFSYEEITETFIDQFDKLLGEGSMKKIFGDNKPTFIHIAQMAVYIANEMNKQREEISKGFYLKND